MLNFLRRKKRSWIITALLAMIIVPFVLYFGVGAWTSSQADTLAEVNGYPIRRKEVETQLARAVESYQELFKGRLTPEMIKSLQLQEAVLDDLIQRRLLLQEAERRGLEVSDEEVAAAISQAPVFQVAGRFSKERYVELLRARRMTPAQFEEEQRQELLLQKLFQLIRDNIHVTELEVRERYDHEAESIDLYFVRIPVADFRSEVKVSEAELKDFYEKNRERFREPARLQVEYVAYPYARFAAEIAVSEKEAEALYQLQREKRFQQPKAARVDHLFFAAAEGADPRVRAAARTAAEAALKEARAGRTFQALAAGGTAQYGDLGWVSPGQLLPELEKAIFALEPGAVSPVVESRLGFHLFKVEQVKAARTQPFAEVKKQILSELLSEKGKAAAASAAEEDRARVLAGAELARVAKERGLAVKQTPLFSLENPPDDLKVGEEFLEKASTMAAGELAPVVEGPQASYLLRVTRREPPQIPPFESVRARVEKELSEKKAFELALQKGKTLIEELRKGVDIKAAAAAHRLRVEETGYFARGAGEIPKIGALQEARAGIPLSAAQPIPDRPYTQKDAVFVLALKGTRPADPAEYEKHKARLLARELEERRQKAVQRFVESLKLKAKVKLSADALSG